MKDKRNIDSTVNKSLVEQQFRRSGITGKSGAPHLTEPGLLAGWQTYIMQINYIYVRIYII